MSATVLILDDSLTVRMDLAEALNAAGFQSIPCGSVAEARHALASTEIDVIILDVILPDEDGVEYLRELRMSTQIGAPTILMLSSEADVKDRIRGIQTGADEYVGKPYDVGYLIARIRELLRTRGSSKSEATSVLLIDDSMTFRQELRHALESEGYLVTEANSGEEGLRAAANQRPGAIIVDGVLPGIDGATVIRRIRLDGALRGVPCLLLTASEEGGAELRALDAGADAFVRKDEDIGLALAKLAAVLRRPISFASSDTTSSLLGPKRILAVADSVTYLNELANSLRNEGYDVALAHCGEEALDLIAVQHMDCILLDVLMPGLGGEETCRRIKSAPLFRDIPLIMMTALEDRGAMIQGLGSGADDYISKSSDLEILKARVRAQIRRKQFEDESRRYREDLLQKELEATEARSARKLAETRATLVEELERKNKELEAFSYSVSHDLRAPLRSIDGFSLALLEDYADLFDDKGKDYLRRVRAAAQRMGDLIDDLLQLSRVTRAELSREHLQLSELVKEVADGLARREPERNVQFVIHQGLVVQADGHLMRVLLDNLLGNAWKFTSKTPNATIEFGQTCEGAVTVYYVRDNGAGFNMEYAAKLFSPFQRLHSEVEFPGTGIGLATVQRIADRHGGRAWAQAQVNHGATMFFTLTRSSTGEHR